MLSQQLHSRHIGCVFGKRGREREREARGREKGPTGWRLKCSAVWSPHTCGVHTPRRGELHNHQTDSSNMMPSPYTNNRGPITPACLQWKHLHAPTYTCGLLVQPPGRAAVHLNKGHISAPAQQHAAVLTASFSHSDNMHTFLAAPHYPTHSSAACASSKQLRHKSKQYITQPCSCRCRRLHDITCIHVNKQTWHKIHLCWYNTRHIHTQEGKHTNGCQGRYVSLSLNFQQRSPTRPQSPQYTHTHKHARLAVHIHTLHITHGSADRWAPPLMLNVSHHHPCTPAPLHAAPAFQNLPQAPADPSFHLLQTQKSIHCCQLGRGLTTTQQQAASPTNTKKKSPPPFLQAR